MKLPETFLYVLSPKSNNTRMRACEISVGKLGWYTQEYNNHLESVTKKIENELDTKFPVEFYGIENMHNLIVVKNYTKRTVNLMEHMTRQAISGEKEYVFFEPEEEHTNDVLDKLKGTGFLRAVHLLTSAQEDKQVKILQIEHLQEQVNHLRQCFVWLLQAAQRQAQQQLLDGIPSEIHKDLRVYRVK